MKKIANIILTVLLLTGVSFAAFTDVPETHWGYEAITKMERLGILSGYPDGTFKPGDDINLGEFATIFSKVFNIAPDTLSSYFPEVEEGHWAKANIEAIRKYIDPTYDPIAESLDIYFQYMPGIKADIKMPREAVIFALYRVYGFDEELYIPGEEQALFADYEEILDPKSICIAYKMNIIKGEEVDGKRYIRPQRYIKRAEFSAMLKNLMGYNDKIENQEGFDVLESVIKNLTEDFKMHDLDSMKNRIYDPNRILHQEMFNMNEYISKDLNSAVDILYKNFSYEVVEHGFTSYNHAFIKINVESLDVSEYTQKVYEDFYNNINTENVYNMMTKEIVPQFLKDYKAKKIDKISVPVTINFIKYDNEWKISL